MVTGLDITRRPAYVISWTTLFPRTRRTRLSIAQNPAPGYDGPMCWYCGSPVTDPAPIGRSLRCSCGKDLRSCRNCRFFLSGARGDCSETNAEPVSDKERGNFCDWFSLNPRFRVATAGEQKSRATAMDAKSAFDNLFK